MVTAPSARPLAPPRPPSGFLCEDRLGNQKRPGRPAAGARRPQPRHRACPGYLPAPERLEGEDADLRAGALRPEGQAASGGQDGL